MSGATDGEVDPKIRSALEHIGKEYVIPILEATREDFLSVREICERENIPSSTAYRRVEELADVGLLEENLRYNGDGEHCRTYRNNLEVLRVERTGDDQEIDVEFRKPGHETQLETPVSDGGRDTFPT